MKNIFAVIIINTKEKSATKITIRDEYGFVYWLQLNKKNPFHRLTHLQRGADTRSICTYCMACTYVVRVCVL